MRGLMLGCGNMGGALLRRWADAAICDFDVVDPAAGFDHPRVRLHRSPDTLPRGAYDLIILAIKPQLIRDVLPGYLGRLAPGGAIVSIAAGFSCGELKALSGGAPAIRIMPNMPAAYGVGMSGMFATRDVLPTIRQAVIALMDSTGRLIEVEEEDVIDQVTAVAGSGPGYVFEIARAFVEAAESLGLDRETARTLVLETMSGAVEMALQSGDDLADLRNAVTSKAGTTEAGLNALNGDGGLSERMKNVVQAAHARAVELRLS